jgi:hypothetical protein
MGIYSTEEETLDVQLLPNLASDRIKIRYTLPAGGKVEILLINLLGQTVRGLYAGRQSKGENQLELDLSNLKPGEYYILINLNNKTVSLPVLKIE